MDRDLAEGDEDGDFLSREVSAGKEMEMDWFVLCKVPP